MIGLTRIYKVNGNYVVAKSPEDAIRIYQEGEDDKIKDILEVRLLADGKYPDYAYIDKWEPTEETELNSIAFLEQMGYTCIPPGKEQKPTNSEKPKEWSEEDEKIKHDIENLIHFALREGSAVSPGANTTKEEALDWLKSLRPKPHWKPSKEQMKSLAQAVCIFATFEHLKDDSKVLTSLYNNLQKLLGI